MKDLGMMRRVGRSGWPGWWLGAVVLGMVLPVYGQYGPGTGEPDDPYQIWEPNQMNAIGANSGDWGKHFRLMADIDMSQFTGTQYNIIGNESTPFAGMFDGNNHKISNLTYTTITSTNHVGVFGFIYKAGIQNLGIEDVSFSTTGNYVGGLVGFNYEGTITECYVTGVIDGSASVGGLVGYNEYGELTVCHMTGTVSGKHNDVGGLVGGNNDSIITDCYANASISGTAEFVGGLVGYSMSSIITGCYANTLINGTGIYVGGLIGCTEGNSITACYATGSVSSSDGLESFVGGLVGWNLGGTIMSCYATCLVKGENEYPYFIGGLVGSNGGKVVSCFWDMQTTGQMGSFGGKGLTTEQMKTMSIYQNAGWAGKGWVINDGEDYPHLSWEGTEGILIPSPLPIPLAGMGTAESPYLIATAEDFAKLSWYSEVLDKHIRLTTNLDVNGILLYPIGDLGSFTGIFDGNGKTIHNVVIYQPDSDNVGLFGYLGNGGQIIDLGVVNSSVVGEGCVGGLVGYDDHGMIVTSYATGSVSGLFAIGGLVGYDNYSTITSSYAACSVNCSYYYAGGLAGRFWGSVINGCYSTSSVSGTGNHMGGLVGDNIIYSIITNCFWDKESSGQSVGVGDGPSTGITGKTTAEIMTLATFTGVGWDFTEGDGDGAEWMMLREGEDYPRLAWQEDYPGDIAGLYGVDMEDLLEVAGNWLEEGCPVGCEEADINGDGFVNLEDLAVLAGDWLKS